jgi:hypothetical protein
MRWEIGMARSSFYDSDGFLGIQYDGESMSGEDALVDPYEAHAIAGVYSRPMDPGLDANGNPDPKQAAQVLVGIEASGKGHIWPMEDPRVIALLPLLNKGERLFYGDFGQFIRAHDDGAWSFYTTDQGGNPAGQKVAMRLAPDGWSVDAPWGRMTFDGNGFFVSVAGGPTFDMSAMSLPAPLDQISSSITMQAKSITLNAAPVDAGPDAGTSQPLVGVTALQQILAALVGAIQAISTTLATGGTSSAGPVVLPGAAAVAPLVQTLQVLIAQLSVPGTPVGLATSVTST